jgi:hypothetical protein
MDRFRWLGSAAIGCFLLVLAVRLPLRWVQGVLPAGIECVDPSGTLWQGACGTLQWQGQPRGAVRWQLRPLQLFKGRLAAQLRVTRDDDSLTGELGASLGGSLHGTDVRLELTLGATPLPGIPPELRGRVHADLARVEWQGKAFTALLGRIEARNITQLGGAAPLALGSYELLFETPADTTGSIHGRIRDLGGPLDVTATMALTRAPGYLLEGSVAPRADAAPELLRQIGYLGAADAAGRRPFAQEATF